MEPLAAASTLVRIVIPALAAVGGIVGGAAGAVVALVKLMPERASIVVSYQGDVIDDLMAENKRLSEKVRDLEARMQAVEDEPRSYLA